MQEAKKKSLCRDRSLKSRTEHRTVELLFTLRRQRGYFWCKPSTRVCKAMREENCNSSTSGVPGAQWLATSVLKDAVLLFVAATETSTQ